MSERNLSALAKEFYETVMSDPQEVITRMCVPDIEWINPMPPGIPFGGRYRGIPGLFDYLGKVDAAIEMQPLHFDQYTEQGNIVTAIGVEAGSLVKATGKTYDMDCVHVVYFNDAGQITKVREYNDIANMLAAFTA
jgi:ketosteroid isomerase-like protein